MVQHRWFKIKPIFTVPFVFFSSLLGFVFLKWYYSARFKNGEESVPSKSWARRLHESPLSSIIYENETLRTNRCTETPPSLGPLRVMSHYDPVEYFDYNATVTNRTDFSWTQLIGLHSDDMAHGGQYQPQQCRARHSTAIVIPYRDREQHLRIWLNHMLPFLKRQQLRFQIFVIEQTNGQKFNRGALLNIGFLQAFRQYFSLRATCVIFHDVDLLPENDQNYYVCDPHGNPKHMSVAINKHRYKLFYAQAIGGVTAFTPDTFRLLNGFSNSYWGWGGEDDDMWLRVKTLNAAPHKLHAVRSNKTVARYKMLQHSKHKKVDEERGRFTLWKNAQLRIQSDGLSNVNYKVENVVRHELFTKITVCIRKTSP